MLRPERLGRWRAEAGALVLICLALLGTCAQAAMLQDREFRATAAASAPSTGMPMASDGVPCALCFVAPTPSPRTFTAESKEPEPSTWWILDQRAPSETRFQVLEHSPERVPIRVAFCRWLD